MKICLATIHAYQASLPLALLYLKANLVERHGHALDAVAIVELSREGTVEQHLAQVMAEQPDVVGLSCYMWNSPALLALARELKAQHPTVKIVLGGPDVGPVGHEVLVAQPTVDAIVRGEGEVPFAEIVDAWADGRELDDVCGIHFRRGDTVIDTADAAIVRDLNLLPSPHSDKFMTFSGRVASIETQRGCVFRCNFCFYNKDLSIRNRRFDLDRVKHELLYWLNRDVHSIYLMDPVFNLNAARAKDICRFIAEHNARGIRIHAEIWAEFMDDELARLMAAANVYWLEVGLQTTDDTTLQAVERRLRMTPFLEGIEHLKRHKLFFELQLIYGLPLETPESFRRSLDFAGQLEPSELSVFMLMILPGTELWKKAASLGINFDPAPPYTVRSHPSMTAADIAAGKRIVDAINVMAASRTVRVLQREPGLSLSTIVDHWNAYRDAQGITTMTGGHMQAFVTQCCEAHGVPADFYRAMMALEYPDETASVTRQAAGDVPRPFPEPPVANQSSQ